MTKKIPIGTKVNSSTHPVVHGQVLEVKEITVLDKKYRIYKVDTNKGAEWVNEKYLR